MFSYTNSDNHGGSDSANLTITIHGTNDAPVAVADAASVTEDTNTLADPNPVSGNVLTNDTDVDSGDTHSVTAVNGLLANVGADVAGTYGTLHLNADGSYTYTLDNTKASVQALAQGASVTDVFNYTKLRGGAGGFFDWFLGAQLLFNDEDLKSILLFGGSAVANSASK